MIDARIFSAVPSSIHLVVSSAEIGVAVQAEAPTIDCLTFQKIQRCRETSDAKARRDRLRETHEIDPVFRHQSGDGRRWIDDTSSGNVVFDIHEVVLLRDGRERSAFRSGGIT